MNQKTHNELIVEKNRLQLEIQREKEKERKQRTRRLIQKGALLEKYFNLEDLSVEDITDVLCVEKANQTVKQHLSEKLVNMLPPKIRDNNVQINEYLEKAVAYYEKMQARRKDKETDFERPL